METFDLLGYKIEVSNELFKYIDLKKAFTYRAEQAEKRFKKIYKERCHSLEDVSKKVDTIFDNVYHEEIEFIMDYLVKNGCYDVDNETFFKNYAMKYYDWDKYYDEINDQYLEIVHGKEQMAQYRDARKAHRGRVVGGGFGLGGAVKGMATAGAMNMASSTMHSIGNAIGNMGTSIASSMSQSTVFNNAKTLKTLADGVYYNVIRLMLAVSDYRTKVLKEKIDVISRAQSEESERYLKNVETRDLEDNIKKELLVKAITVDIFNVEAYEYICKHYGDDNGEVTAITTYLGLDREIIQYKQSLLADIINNIDVTTEEKALQSKQLLLKEMENVGVKDELPALVKIDEALNVFDVEARTINDILFDDRETSVIAQQEKEIIEGILVNFETVNEAELLKCKEDIISNNFKTIIQDSYLEKVNEKLEVFDIQERTVNEILFDTREESNTAKNEKQTIENLLVNFETIDEQTLFAHKDSIINAGFKTVIKDGYIVSIDQRLQEIDIQEKTAFGELFETREEARVYRERVEAYNLKVEQTFSRLIIEVNNNINPKITKNFLYQNQNDSANNKITHAIKRYATSIGKLERPLFIFTTGLLKNGDKGFLITSQKVYSSIANETGVNQVDIAQITNLYVNGTNLVINDVSCPIDSVGKNSLNEIEALVLRVLSELKTMNS